MIKGHGIDIEELSSIREIFLRKPQFAERVLTSKEMERFSNLSEKRKVEYLAGRWSAKEAFAKAWGTGIGSGLSFQDLEILTDEKGAPVVTKSPFQSGKVWVSISHTGSLVSASVILEEI